MTNPARSEIEWRIFICRSLQIKTSLQTQHLCETNYEGWSLRLPLSAFPKNPTYSNTKIFFPAHISFRILARDMRCFFT